MLVATLVGGLVLIRWLLLQPDNVLFRPFSGQISDPRAKVIIGPYPTEDDFRVLKNNKVTTIISLLDPSLPYESALLTQERQLAHRYNMQFYSFPMSSVLGMGFGAQYAQHAHEAATVALREPGKVYLHCYLGLHRVKVVQEMVASLGGRYEQYRLRNAEREPRLQLIDAAQASFDAGQYEQVLYQLRRLKLQTPQLTMLEGWSLYRLGRIVDADKSFHIALKQSTSAWDAHSGLGYCALNRNRVGDAEQEFNRVLSVNPINPAALVGLGLVRYRQGRDVDAARYLEKSLKSGTPNAEAEEILRKIQLKERVSRTPSHADRGDLSGPAKWLKAGAKPAQQTAPD